MSRNTEGGEKAAELATAHLLGRDRDPRGVMIGELLEELVVVGGEFFRPLRGTGEKRRPGGGVKLLGPGAAMRSQDEVDLWERHGLRDLARTPAEDQTGARAAGGETFVETDSSR